MSDVEVDVVVKLKVKIGVALDNHEYLIQEKSTSKDNKAQGLVLIISVWCFG